MPCPSTLTWVLRTSTRFSSTFQPPAAPPPPWPPPSSSASLRFTRASFTDTFSRMVRVTGLTDATLMFARPAVTLRPGCLTTAPRRLGDHSGPPTPSARTPRSSPIRESTCPPISAGEYATRVPSSSAPPSTPQGQTGRFRRGCSGVGRWEEGGGEASGVGAGSGMAEGGSVTSSPPPVPAPALSRPAHQPFPAF